MIDLGGILESIYPDIALVCRTIHENPELSMQEYDTCALLEEKVRANVAFERIKRVGETGLFVELKGTKPGPERVICLRGDMDALPIQEAEGHDPRSKKPGIMHACGHDVHASALLGAACALSKCRDQFSGTVYFFFQPAEETLQGARLFLNDPDIDFSKISGAAAVHVMHSLYAGKVGVKKGPMLAAADELFVTIHGKSSHGATPQNGVDAIVVQANIILALQTLISRETSPLDSAIITFGTIKGGTAHNIIADTVELHGTLRTLTKETRARLHESIERVCTNTAAALGATVDVKIVVGTPPLICEDEWVDRAVRVGKIVVGEENVVMLPEPGMGGEDFAFIKERCPGVFVRIGCRTVGGPFGQSHSPNFYCDPLSLKNGIAMLCGIALDYFEAAYR